MQLWRWRNSTSLDEAKILRYLLNNYNVESLTERKYRIDIPPEEYDGQPGVLFDADGLMTVKTICSHHMVVKKLITDGYLIEHVDEHQERPVIIYEVTDEGKFFFQNRRRERVRFLRDSILVPIVVSIVVAYVVSVLVQGS